MPIAKAERLMDLVIALLNARYPRSASWIRSHVAGYDDAASDEAFARTFERDKAELRDLGVPIETDPGTDGYRIRPGDFALPPLELTAEESAALAVASRMWAAAQFRESGRAAERKVRDASDAANPPESSQAAPGEGASHEGTDPGIQVRLRAPEPSFPVLLSATRERRVVRFDYRAAGRVDPEQRHVQPWGLVNFHGAWYLVGHDRGRDARRTFRLSRIVGTVTPTGRPGAFTVPAGVVLRDEVASAADADDLTTALLRIRAGRAAGLRRGATVLSSVAQAGGEPPADEFDEVTIPVHRLADTARQIAGYAGDVVVVDPPELREAVIDLLRAFVPTVDQEVPS